MKEELDNLLLDTWWFGLTNRIDDKQFQEMARLRKTQGFNGIQLVVGIPPEVGPLHPSARSKNGPAWDLQGHANQAYLDAALERVKFLNKIGMKPVLYGAWGHQIEWIGTAKMINWWGEIIRTFDNLDPIYCLTGESDLWVGTENLVYPDKSVDDLQALNFVSRRGGKLLGVARRANHLASQVFFKRKLERRRDKWSSVLENVHSKTNNPVIIHVNPGVLSENVVNNPQFLSAITAQTGHSQSSKDSLWKIPIEVTSNNPNKPFINLEPWYEGITDDFYTEDQLYSYWVSMLGGASSYAYGTQGIWNMGDGKFMSHWGKQTLEEGLALETPTLIGRSHALYVAQHIGVSESEVGIDMKRGKLARISRRNKETGSSVSYYPKIELAGDIDKGRIWDPIKGDFVSRKPSKGQIVVISE